MYKLFSLVFCLTASLVSYAHPVSQAEALRVASAFCASHRSDMGLAKSVSPESFGLSIAYSCKPTQGRERMSLDSEETYYYVFNVGKGNGYIVVSGDDRARQVLAYASEGTFDATRLSPALASWLGGYEQEMRTLMSVEEDGDAMSHVGHDFTYPATAIQPLLQTRWNQGSPYNLDCPTITENGTETKALVGCTATALAQIMKYYEWPVRPSGFIDYKDNYAVRTMNFDEQSPFDWGNMRSEYTTGYTDREAQAVAHLSACAAYASKMYFSTSYSGSYPIDAALALTRYFGYDANTYIYDSRFHAKEEWYKIMIGELEAGRPILYDGFNDKGGHVFVCDGYDGKGYFHFNWGWSGTSDGYFSLSALNPSKQGAGATDGGYSFKQLMICHIQLPNSATEPQAKKVYLCSDVTLSSATTVGGGGEITTPRGADVGVDFWFDRESTSEFYASMVLGYMSQGVFHPLSDVYNAKCAPNPNSYYAGVRTLRTDGLEKGTYEIGWYFREYGSDGEWQRMTAANGNPDAIRLTVGEENQTLSVVSKDFHLSMESQPKVQPVYAGESKSVPLRIVNDGSVRLEGRVGFRCQKVGSENVAFASALAYCEPGESTTVYVKLDFSDAAKGDVYELTPVYGAVNNIYYGLAETNMVRLAESQTVELIYKPSLAAWAPNNTYYILDGASKTIEVVLSQRSKLRPWAGRVYGKILRNMGSEYEDTGIEAWSDYQDMPTRQDVKLKLQVADMDQLSESETYKLVLRIDDGYESDCGGTALHEAPLMLENMASSISLPMPADGVASIYKVDGTCVQSDVHQKEGRLDVHLPAGLYIVRMVSPTAVYSKKIIIK